MRHSMRWHHDFSNVAAITAVLVFLVAITGIPDRPMESTQETGASATSRTVTLSDPENSEFVSIRLVLSGDTAVVAENDGVRQPAPSRTEHCPMNLGLSVACPDVLSSAVAPSSVPGVRGSASAAGAAAQPAGALPGAPLHPVSLIRLPISRV